MSPIEKPVYQPAAKSILRSFQLSHKKHLLITGSRGTGKSTIARQIMQLLSNTSVCSPFPGFITRAIPKSQVILKDSLTGQEAIIGCCGDHARGNASAVSKSLSALEYQNQMLPVTDGFLDVGIPSIEHALASTSDWAFLDEIGYLEGGCPSFQEKILQLFDQKQVIAVLRGQSLSFLAQIKNRTDAYLLDLDHPFLPVGCVIMASGMGKRFGSNKLLADFCGEPLISHILKRTDGVLFSEKVTVTRYPEIEKLCADREIDVILHNLPGRNDTVRLGLSRLLETSHSVGCIFVPADQPLLTKESLETMLLSFSHIGETAICRLNGSPVLFGRKYFDELLALPSQKGGGILLEKYAEQVLLIPTDDPDELTDIDTHDDLKKLEKIKKSSE